MTKHVMNVMDPTGHTEIKWSADNEEEVGFAKDAFDAAVKKGYQAFKVGKLGRQGERMTAFDPEAEKMLLVPQLKGG